MDLRYEIHTRALAEFFRLKPVKYTDLSSGEEAMLDENRHKMENAKETRDNQRRRYGRRKQDYRKAKK